MRQSILEFRAACYGLLGLSETIAVEDRCVNKGFTVVLWGALELGVVRIRNVRAIPTFLPLPSNCRSLDAERSTSTCLALCLEGTLRCGAKSARRTPANKERSLGTPPSGRDDNVVGGANEEREEAGSLAPLGMTNQKNRGKNNSNSNSRFPAGMTNQKSKGKNNGRHE